MNPNNRDYYPGEWHVGDMGAAVPSDPPKKKKTCSVGFLISMLCIVAAISIILTYTLTSAANRAYYSEKLAVQQETIDRLKADNGVDADIDFDKLEVLAALFERYSYYAGQVSEEELLTAVLKAYAEATGDLYAEYYTDEEYKALTDENVGDYEGIGVSVIQTTLTVSDYEYMVFQIIAVYADGPAADSELQVGDMIYSVKADGSYQLVNTLGYTKAISMIKGEKGTQAEFAAFRKSGEGYESLEFSITRDTFESVSVNYKLAENDPTVGIVQISNFDLTTPHQFKEAVNALLAQNVQKFVFDVRNNPGGDLQSIKAVLTYFLQKGDLILSAIDKNGNTATSYYAEATKLSGDYASCSVAENEIGMYASLNMVVLCNGNTASAAEVFTATLRDYGLAKVVGETTFGKGIMQSFLPLAMFGNYSGYVKMTTYAYVTKCGITYHDIGIDPSEGCEVALSDEAKKYNIYVLPQALDNQLQTAISQLQS
ncbi:MAG: hypothetical protein IJW55_03795 [Clostridia bacterium]|nr:hypothetical protein [Clostridia bacterium]